MADNLNVKIGADSAPAIQQIGLLQASLRSLRKDYKELADQIEKGGASDQTRARYAAVSQQIAVTDRQLRQLTRDQREHQGVTKEGADSLKEMGLEFGHLAHAVGLPIEGIKALKFGFAAFATGELVRGITDVNDKISELRDLANQTRFDPGTIKAWTEAIEQAGGKADTAKEAISGFAEAFIAQQKAAIDARVEAQRAARLEASATPIRAAEAGALAGARPGSSGADAAKAAAEAGQAAAITAHFSEQMRNAQTSIDAAYTSLARLGVTAGAFTTDAKGMQQAAGVAAKSLLELNKTSSIEADILSRDVFKKPFASLVPLFKAAADGSAEAQQHLIDLANEANKAFEANKQYQAAVNALSKAWDDLAQTLVIAVGPAIGIVIELLARMLKGWDQAVRIAQEFIDLFRAASNFPEPTEATAAHMKAAGIPTNAAGGYIRGPGSGTSDSILARLSNGEFVMNAASVRRLGVGFLHGLNNFALGGLVGAPPIRFAGGGVVGAAASTPVHLHIGGGSFAMSASSGVAAALVVEAKRSQLVSAGIKPSWYGR
jgi:hypothetical protein